MEKNSKLLKQLYTSLDSKVSFSSPQRVYEEARKTRPQITLKEVKDFLAGQRTFTLHKPAIRRFRRLKFVPSGLGTHFQADLAVLDRLGAENEGYKYILLAVEILSRKIYVKPLKTKSGSEVAKAFESIFKDFKDLPFQIVVDQGREFLNKHVRATLKKYDIRLKSTYSQPKVKAAFAEVYVKLLKNKIYKYFTETGSETWIDVLEKIAQNMNNSVNTTTGFAPNKINYKNSSKVWKKLYGQEHYERNLKPKFKIGAAVRILKDATVFNKGYRPNASEEIFYIIELLRFNTAVVAYRLEDVESEKIEGWFYEKELVEVDREKTSFSVEEILNERKTKKGTEYFVKWTSYNSKFNSWVHEKNFLK